MKVDKLFSNFDRAAAIAAHQRHHCDHCTSDWFYTCVCQRAYVHTPEVNMVHTSLQSFNAKIFIIPLLGQPPHLNKVRPCRLYFGVISTGTQCIYSAVQSLVKFDNHDSVHSGAVVLTLLPPISLMLYTLPYGSNPSFLILDIQVLWHSGLSARASECQK